MNISEAAARTGVPAKTIRYYESIGLVDVAARTSSGYRDYGADDVQVLLFLRRARSLGFSVERCRELLSLYRDRRRASADVRSLAHEHLRELTEKIRALEEMKSVLETLVAQCHGDDRPHCPILETLAGPERGPRAADVERPSRLAPRSPHGKGEAHMATARDVVEQYLNAFYSPNHQTARRYLADDFSFSGPAASFSSPDEFLKVSGHVSHGVRAVQQRKVFVDGPDVCVFYELVLNHRVGTMPIAEWYHLSGDKISSIRLIMDTGPFTARRPVRSEDTAVDPVCRMELEKASATTTRSHDGTTYYFCNPGCAVAFEEQPGKYLSLSR
jgi:MerR family transcriptional regulator, copper efflux regulator